MVHKKVLPPNSNLIRLGCAEGAVDLAGGGSRLRRDGLGVVEEGGGAEHGGDDGEEAEREHQRQPGHRQIQQQLRAVEHRPQRHPLPFPDPSRARLRCALLGESPWLYHGHGSGEADRARGEEEEREEKRRDTRRGGGPRGGGEPTTWRNAREIGRAHV